MNANLYSVVNWTIYNWDTFFCHLVSFSWSRVCSKAYKSWKIL